VRPGRIADFSMKHCRKVAASMSNQTNFYRERAAEARGRADDTDLSNVKESHIRSATAWELLASRSEKSDRLREAEIERKAEMPAQVSY